MMVDHLVAAGAWGAALHGGWYDACVVMGALVASIAAVLWLIERVEVAISLDKEIRALLGGDDGSRRDER